MPAYIVKQLNKKFARFSTVVDNFTHYDLNRPNDVDGFYGSENRFGPKSFKEAIEIVFFCHGLREFNKVRKLFKLRPITKGNKEYKRLSKIRNRDYPVI